MIFIKKLYEPTDSPFLIVKQKFNKSYEMNNRHYHNHYELYHLLSDERHYFVKDRSYHVKSGDIVLINKNYLHRTFNAASYRHEKIMIYFKENFITDLFRKGKTTDLFTIFQQNSNVIRLNIKDQELIQSILFKILDEYNKSTQKDNKMNISNYNKTGILNKDILFHIKILLTELLYSLKKINEKEKEDFKHTSSLHKRISDIAQYINKNYQKDINLSSTANNFSLNPYYLSSLFKKITGFSFIEYLNLVRIKEAKKLLNTTNLYITEVSEEVGFNTLSHFGRVFKKYNDISPSKYRKFGN